MNEGQILAVMDRGSWFLKVIKSSLYMASVGSSVNFMEVEMFGRQNFSHRKFADGKS